MPHLHSRAIAPATTWPSDQERDQVLIDWDRRHRRRHVLRTEGGQELLLDLSQAARLRDGDGLVVPGGFVRVQARPEPVMDIHAHGPGDLVRMAWHLGNRHLPVQLLDAQHLRIRSDHVIGDMVRALGGHVLETSAPFDPEAGAYAGGHHHHHDGDDDEHGHAHGHGHHHHG